eukprot:TRINITY_DN2896_c0_g1_i1.p1 TRINITY_DN2896_c0_g1~~TRINITY_DN2896_c0_g1_i1.p1  ORF type:complete len:452 (-),score=70.06 TRINITY_DN2896_c0_g1_i1:35-1390(-)
MEKEGISNITRIHPKKRKDILALLFCVCHVILREGFSLLICLKTLPSRPSVMGVMHYLIIITTTTTIIITRIIMNQRQQKALMHAMGINDEYQEGEEDEDEDVMELGGEGGGGSGVHSPPAFPRDTKRNEEKDQQQADASSTTTTTTRPRSTNFEIDWSTRSNEKGIIQWCAFYADVGHEIREVTEGYRLTVTYHLYCTKLQETIPRPQFQFAENSPNKFFQEFSAALATPCFYYNGATLGFGLMHKYALKDGAIFDPKNPGLTFKGRDSLVYRVMKQLGCDVQFYAVYKPHTYHRCIDWNNVPVSSSKDCTHCSRVDGIYLYNVKGEEYYLTKNFYTIGRDEYRNRYGGGGDGDGGDNDAIPLEIELERLPNRPDYRPNENIVWFTPPGSETWNSSYIPEGNTPHTEVTYVYGALVVDIKPWPQRSERYAAAGAEASSSSSSSSSSTSFT